MPEWTHSISNDNEYSREFSHHLGYALLNCGTLENLTYSYAATLNKKHYFDTGLAGKRFSERKKAVLKYIEATDMDQSLKSKCLDYWGQTTEIMRVRNLVAHNPINRLLTNPEKDPSESLIGVIDMTKSTPTNIVHLDATKLANLANLASDLAHNLEECLTEIQAQTTDEET